MTGCKTLYYNMDVVIDELIIEEDRPEHIAKHNITIEEVLEVLTGDYLVIEGKLVRSLLIGKTKDQRLITVVVGIRRGVNRYGLITARSAKKKEKALYLEKFQSGGELNEGKDS